LVQEVCHSLLRESCSYEEGFLADPEAWSEEAALDMAREQGMETLDKSFRGGVYEWTVWVDAWGVQCERNIKCRYPRSPSGISRLAASKGSLSTTPCERLAQNILSNPEAFARTTLILASGHFSSQEAVQPVVFH